jgi:hypothetical protein
LRVEAIEAASDRTLWIDREIGRRAVHVEHREHVADAVDHRDRRLRVLRLRFEHRLRDDLLHVGDRERIRRGNLSTAAAAAGSAAAGRHQRSEREGNQQRPRSCAHCVLLAAMRAPKAGCPGR